MNKPFFGPNVDDATALDIFRNPDAFPWLWSSIGGWIFHAAHVLQDYTRDPPLACPFSAWTDVGAWGQLSNRDVTTWLHMECVESWDPFGDRCRERVAQANRDILAEGGRPWGVLADSPMTKALAGSNIPGYGLPTGGTHSLQSIAACIANAVREAHDLGLEFVLVENLGKLPPSTLIEGVRIMKDDHGQLIDGFEWDPWPAELKPSVGHDNAKFKALGVPVSGICCGSGELHTQADYARTARIALTRYRTIPGIDRLSVLSFHTMHGDGDAFQTNNNLRWVPAALPETDPTSHLAILRDVIAAS